ncbi:MAG: hypothetical protein R3B95_07695 [Nitrospirales bacterium]|nr:hypothetical protein [Nitrospirales bacterium]
MNSPKAFDIPKALVRDAYLAVKRKAGGQVWMGSGWRILKRISRISCTDLEPDVVGELRATARASG